MEASNQSQSRRELIGNFIKLRNIGTPQENLFIRFDDLVTTLLQSPQLRFSPSKFEDMLRDEIEKKVIGRDFNQEVFNRICDYIWDLAIYCTAERIKDERRTTQILEERAGRKRSQRVKRTLP